MEKEVWKKRENESDAAYKCFNEYLEMPKTRSLNYLSELIKKNIYIIKKWYTKHNWEERAAAYDKKTSCNTENTTSIRQMYKRHIEKAVELQNLAIKKFREIDPSTLTNAEMIRFLSAGANLEKSARKGFEQSTKETETAKSDYLEQLRKFVDK